MSSDASSEKVLPYSVEYHTPIMVHEILEALQVRSGGVYLDGTLGGGGHTHAMLDACGPDGVVFAIDRDPEAMSHSKARLERFGARFQPWLGNYSRASELLKEHGCGLVDGWLIDAGVSSHQLDALERGFSYRFDAPLDMRMGPDATSLGEFLDGATHGEVAHALHVYSDIDSRTSSRLSKAILEDHHAHKLDTTFALRDLVSRVFVQPRSRKKKAHPASLVFQALRIAVNHELEHLEAAVSQVLDVVRPGGYAAFMSFHSLEDRIIKHGFREMTIDCVCPPRLPQCACDVRAKVRLVSRKPTLPTAQEVELNSRARSAKLRVIQVLDSFSL